MPPILLGTSITGRGESVRRETAAQASLYALARSGAAACVNLDFADSTPPEGAFETMRELRRDARTVSGIAAARKPVIPEMVDVLVREAERRGIARVGLVNGDIIVLPEALARDRQLAAPAVGYGRTDTGGDLREANLLYGIDMFTFDVQVWKDERHRFRDYLLGERVWDNVYAAIVVSLGGVLLNRERLILHERHPSAPLDSPYAPYIQRLAARDSSYFSAWCTYVRAAEALRSRDGSFAEEYQLQRALMRPPGVVARIMDAARGAWWGVRHAAGA